MSNTVDEDAERASTRVTLADLLAKPNYANIQEAKEMEILNMSSEDRFHEDPQQHQLQMELTLTPSGRVVESPSSPALPRGAQILRRTVTPPSELSHCTPAEQMAVLLKVLIAHSAACGADYHAAEYEKFGAAAVQSASLGGGTFRERIGRGLTQQLLALLEEFCTLMEGRAKLRVLSSDDAYANRVVVARMAQELAYAAQPVMHALLRTLCLLLRHPANIEVVSEEEVLQTVCVKMRADVSDAPRQRYGCEIIAAMAQSGPVECQMAMQEGAVQRSLSAMEGHPEDATLQETALGALWALAVDAESREAILGRLKLVVEAGVKHFTSERVAENLTGMLWEVAALRDAAMRIVHEEGLNMILYLMQQHTTNAQVQENGHGALWQLARHDKAGQGPIAGRVVTVGGVQFALDSVQWHSTNVGMLEYPRVHLMPLWLAAVGAIWRDTTIEVLDLSDRNLHDLEAADIAPHLESDMTIIHTVKLQYNHIGDEGAILLADSLRRNKRITTMHLKANRITNIGAERLIKAVEANPDFKMLDLRENGVSQDRLDRLGKLLRVKRFHEEEYAGLLDGWEELVMAAPGEDLNSDDDYS